MEAEAGLRRGVLAALVAAVALLVPPPGSAGASRLPAAGTPPAAGVAAATAALARVELHLVPDARVRSHVVLMTLGGPIYCKLLLPIARTLKASRLCPDYYRNRAATQAQLDDRIEDWGDPAYLDAVAALPGRLRRDGVRISKLVLVGVSYAGYANAQLAATHPELHAAALVVIDSYLDLAARLARLAPTHRTWREMVDVLGGTSAQRPAAYAARSPSGNLGGLASAIRGGMRTIFVWSVGAREERLFNGATCAADAIAGWLPELAAGLGRPVTGYVTTLGHGDVLRVSGQRLLALVGIGQAPAGTLPATRFVFAAGQPPPAGSFCRDA